MDLGVQENKHCEDCRYFSCAAGDFGTCGVLYYDLSMGSHNACDKFEQKREDENEI